MLTGSKGSTSGLVVLAAACLLLPHWKKADKRPHGTPMLLPIPPGRLGPGSEIPNPEIPEIPKIKPYIDESRRLQAASDRPETRRCLSATLNAGVDLRTTWRREAQRVGGRCGAAWREIGAGVGPRPESPRDGAGGGRAASSRRCLWSWCRSPSTPAFPELLRSLAQTFDQQLRFPRRQFLARIVWPMTELSIAVLIVGFLIWIMGTRLAPRKARLTIFWFSG